MRKRLTRHAVADLVEARINQGEWKPGEALPYTKDFAKQFKVSESTVFNAMDILKSRGTITGQQGGRRYVAEPTQELSGPDFIA